MMDEKTEGGFLRVKIDLSLEDLINYRGLQRASSPSSKQ